MDVELVLELLFLMLVVCSRVVFAHLRRVNWGPELSWATNSCISLQTAFFSRMPWPLVAVGEFASVLDARAVLRFWMPEQCFGFGCQSSASCPWNCEMMAFSRKSRHRVKLYCRCCGDDALIWRWTGWKFAWVVQGLLLKPHLLLESLKKCTLDFWDGGDD